MSAAEDLLFRAAWQVVASQLFPVYEKCDGPFEKGAYYFPSDYSIRCGSRRHRAMLAYGVVFTLVYPVGVPLLYALLLWRHKGQIMAQGKKVVSEHNPLDAFRFLFEAYRPEVWYFSLVTIGQKVLYAAFQRGLPAASTAQLLSLLLTSLAYGASLLLLKPYIDRSNEILAVVGFFQIHLTVIATIGLRLGIGRIIQWLVVGLSVATGVLGLYQALYECYNSGQPKEEAGDKSMAASPRSEPDPDEKDSNGDSHKDLSRRKSQDVDGLYQSPHDDGCDVARLEDLSLSESSEEGKGANQVVMIQMVHGRSLRKLVTL
jgi:hypothetical protein